MKKIAILTLCLFSFSVLGNEDLFNPVLNAIKSEKYKQAFFFLKNIKPDNENDLHKKIYLEGICLNKLKRFDLSIKRFSFLKTKKL